MTNDEALLLTCPGCGNLPTKILGYGWLFRCVPCDWNYGHPQVMGHTEASELLWDAEYEPL